MDQPLGLYKGKLKEALTLVNSMSSDKQMEAVSYWNHLARELEAIICSGQNEDAPISNAEQPDALFTQLADYSNYPNLEPVHCEADCNTSNIVGNSSLVTPSIKPTPPDACYRESLMEDEMEILAENITDQSSNVLDVDKMDLERSAGAPNNETLMNLSNETFQTSMEQLKSNLFNYIRQDPETPGLDDQLGYEATCSGIDNNHCECDAGLNDYDNSQSNAQAIDPSNFVSTRDEAFTQSDRPLQTIQPYTDSYTGQTILYGCSKYRNCCLDCNLVFDSSEELDHHQELHYPRSTLTGDDEEDPLRITKEIKKEFDTSIDGSHLIDTNTCGVCGKSGYSTKGNLKRHLKTHSGDKPFKCDHCESRFTEKKSLKVHERRHTGEKPYKCDICSKLFSQAGVLQSHRALHLNERKFSCDRCGKSFRQRSQLKLHTMRHDGVKRLECPTCRSKFLTRGDLERHRRIHTGERPYSCEICSKTFTRQQSLNEHMNRHTGRRPYDCKYCDKSFAEMSACYKHAKTHKHQESQNQLELSVLSLN